MTDQGRSGAVGGAGENPLEVRSDPRAIDGPWLTAVLERAGVARGATVREVEFGGFIGTGQAGRNARLHLSWDDPQGRPGSLVGKFPSDHPGTRAGLFASGTYLKEWVFYDRIAHTIDLRSPRCYAALYDDATPDFVLLMEDIAGSCQGDQIEGLGVDQVALAVAEAVNLHAPRWGDASLQADVQHGQAVQSSGESAQFAQAFYEAALPDFLDRLAARLDPDVVALAEFVAPMIARWFEGTASPRTLVHNDFRGDNFLFGQTPEDPPIVVVDFQSLSLGVGAIDIAYVIAGSFPDPTRRAEVERDLLDDYRARMARAGVDQSSDDLWRDYRYGSLWGLLMSVLASMAA